MFIFRHNGAKHEHFESGDKTAKMAHLTYEVTIDVK